MSSIVWSHPLEANSAAQRIEPAQQTAARLAGLLYLLMMFIAMFGELYARSRLIVANDALQTATNLAASPTLFRIGIVSVLIKQAGDVVLLWALYIVLSPVNKNLALLAAFWRLVECSSFGMIALTDFGALRLAGGTSYLRAFDSTQLAALSRFFISVHHPGGQIAMFFFALGSTLFAFLWFQSGYIHRALAVLGIAASLLVLAGTFAILLVPAVESFITPAYWIPIFVFEVTLGFWLLLKGIR